MKLYKRIDSNGICTNSWTSNTGDEKYYDITFGPKNTYTIQIIDLDKDYNYQVQICNRNRLLEYPPISDLLDAFLTKDDSAMELYRNRYLAVQLKYPKPIK